MSTIVTSKGQVTIPKKVRDLLGIKSGSAVDFVATEDGRVVLKKVGGRTKRAPSAFALVRGSASVKMSTDEIMRLTRGEG